MYSYQIQIIFKQTYLTQYKFYQLQFRVSSLIRVDLVVTIMNGQLYTHQMSRKVASPLDAIDAFYAFGKVGW